MNQIAMLSPEAVSIWQLLVCFRGRGQAITAARMAARLGIGDAAGTHVRDVISHYIGLYPEPVGAHPDAGYFVIETAEEMQDYLAGLEHRATLIFERATAVRSVAKARGWQCLGDHWYPPAVKAPQGALFQA